MGTKNILHFIMSWWSLGEGSGFMGSEVALYRIQCAFCNESGNWEQAFHAEKKKPGSEKRINFDVYKCGNCAGYIHILWSAQEHFGSHRLHNYHTLPWPQGKPEPSENWPTNVQRFWSQAHNSLDSENFDAAVVMARSALQATLRDHEAEGRNLQNEINDLASKGVLPPIMREWSDELRLMGNNSAHPETDQEEINPEDARDLIKFLDYLLKYLYDLPKQIEQYRTRAEGKENL